MNAPGDAAGWRKWVVKVLVGANALLTIVVFRLPPSALPYRWVVPVVQVWFVTTTILATLLLAANLTRKLSRKRRPKLSWTSLAVDALLVLGWWVTVAYFVLMAQLAGAAGVPAG